MRDLPYLWHPASGTAVPGYSIVAITGVSSGRDRTVMTVAQATATSTLFAASGRFTRDDCDVCFGPVMIVKYTGTLAAGDRCKATVGSWTIEKAGSGPFTCIGVVDSTNKLAAITQDQNKGSKLFKAPTGGIPGRVGTLLGSATCTIYEVNSVGQLVSTSETQVVYNWSTSLICSTGDRYGVASWVMAQYIAVAEDCNDTGPSMNAASSVGTGGTAGDGPPSGSVTPASGFGVGNVVPWKGSAADPV